MNSLNDRVIIALDLDDLKSARGMVKKLSGLVSFFKVGSELFSSAGPDAVKMVTDLGGRVFLDLKFFDIPNTVYRAVSAVSALGVSMLNVHAMGGTLMMQAAARAASEVKSGPKVLGVTVLTSFDEGSWKDVGFSAPVGDAVINLAVKSKDAGLDGVVCSPLEVTELRRRLGGDFLLITPGVRPEWAQAHDQKRTMTPRDALRAGSDFIVIGRPITEADDPYGATMRIIEEISGLDNREKP